MVSLKDIKILIVLNNLDLGGAERQAILLGQYLKEQTGADVNFCTLASRFGKVGEELKKLNIPCHAFSLGGSDGISSKIFVLIKFVIFLYRTRPGVILPFTDSPNILCGLLWRLSRVKNCVWNQRDVIKMNKYNWLRRLTVKLVPQFVANSQTGKEFLINNFQINSNKIKVINNGVILAHPLVDRKEFRQKLDLNDHTFVVTMVANLSGNKDHGTLLKAWKKILEINFDREVKLLLAGRFDSEFEKLKKLADELGVVSSVLFLGQVDDIPSLLQASDLGVLCTYSEGLPNTVLEYMVAKLPVVATDVSGVREVLGNDYSFLVPIGDPEELANKIINFIQHTGLGKDLGLQNHQRVLSGFSLERMYFEYFNLLSSLDS